MAPTRCVYNSEQEFHAHIRESVAWYVYIAAAIILLCVGIATPR